tara:strand:+ start:838 stop:1860 length:1023 start_codon:yes stop_codon:yes gene_type:complete
MIQIFYINFNQDRSCFCLGTEEGYTIYSTDPLKKIFERKFEEGLVCLEMLFRSNILALVKKNTDTNPDNEKNVLIWDDSTNNKIGEIIFNTPVKEILLRKDYIVVILENKIFVYELQTLVILASFNTCDNPKGIGNITYYQHKFLLAIPSSKIGILHVYNLLSNPRSVVSIQAHESDIQFIALNTEGSLVATCSKKGTLIRIFNTLTGKLFKELRRGSDQVKINWLEFSFSSHMIICQSNKGTIHLFNTGFKESNRENKSLFGVGLKSFQNFIPKFSPSYLTTEWSFAKFHFPELKTISAFLIDGKHIVAISFTGIYYKINFEEDEFVTVSKKNIFELEL